MPPPDILSRPRHRAIAAHGRAPLALLLALLLTLALLLSSSHTHRDGAGAHACAVCAVLADTLPGAAPDAAPLPCPVLQRHLAPAAPRYRCVYRAAMLLPPSCGPPSHGA